MNFILYIVALCVYDTQQKEKIYLKINRNIKLDSLEGHNNIKSDLKWNRWGKLAAADGWFSPLALKERRREEKGKDLFFRRVTGSY